MSKKLDHEKLNRSRMPSTSIAGEAWFRKEQQRKDKAKAKKAKRIAKASRKAVKARQATAVWAVPEEAPRLIRREDLRKCTKAEI